MLYVIARWAEAVVNMVLQENSEEEWFPCMAACGPCINAQSGAENLSAFLYVLPRFRGRGSFPELVLQIL